MSRLFIQFLVLQRVLTAQELYYLVGAGTLATISQVSLSKAYAYAPAGKIGPANYLAIIFAGICAWLLWGEKPDLLAVMGMLLIFLALMLCLPRKSKDVMDHTLS